MLARVRDKSMKVLRLLRSLGPAPRNPGLSVGMTVAYDWRLAIEALRRVYGIADEIVLGLDGERISWAGKRYHFEERAFRSAIKKLDGSGKIRVLEGRFHGKVHPGHNETDERNAISLACRPGNWIVQIDADEWMINPDEFRAWILARPIEREIMAQWYTVFKVIGRTALVVDTDDEWQRVGTSRRGAYWQHRETGAWRLRSPLKLLHFSWGRSEADVARKVRHWGHANDFDTAAFLKLWKSVTLKNYRELRNFHYLEKTLWPRLKAVSLDSLEREAGRDGGAR